ncbi:hypothetical protein LQ327_33010 [Actinomycetospora endophytica]|uniref:Uncharacterized protein n=1 Tax=Actinomycetospora endophytica TaxID=2291215 RepID=A0ABS8PIX0_9PSEU|nr:hypothetical protein [Actinomycetospora endophytica]MCD2198201.1 hypothetical protein [Actinomycetospora endophytica]
MRTPRQRERRYLWWFAALFVVVAAASAVAGVLIGRSEHPGEDTVSSGQWALLIAIVVGFAVLCGAVGLGFTLWRRRRGSAMFARSPLWELPTQKERRGLVRDLRRERPIDPHRRELAVRVARDFSRRRGLIWVYLALGVVNGGNAAIQDSPARWFYLAASVIFLGIAAWWVWLITRMRRATDRLATDSAF